MCGLWTSDSLFCCQRVHEREQRDAKGLTGLLKTWFRKDIAKRALRVSLVVGTLLVLINHGEDFLGGTSKGTAIYQIVLTYLVPYCVSTYSSVMTLPEKSGHNPPR